MRLMLGFPTVELSCRHQTSGMVSLSMTGRVSGRTPRQRSKASAACSTSMPTPSAIFVAPARCASREERGEALAIGEIVGEAALMEHAGGDRRRLAEQAGRGGVDDEVIAGALFRQRSIIHRDERAVSRMRGAKRRRLSRGAMAERQFGRFLGQEKSEHPTRGAAGPEQQDAAALQGHAEIDDDVALQPDAVVVRALRAFRVEGQAIHSARDARQLLQSVGIGECVHLERRRDVQSAQTLCAPCVHIRSEAADGPEDRDIVEILAGLLGESLVDDGRLGMADGIANDGVKIGHAMAFGWMAPGYS